MIAKRIENYVKRGYHYVLAGKEPVVEPDFLKWAVWFEEAERHVDKTDLVVDGEEITVSTVFLGLDHNFGREGDPLLFETMIFGGKYDQKIRRCSTWAEAEEQHRVAVSFLRGELPSYAISQIWRLT